jgi:hypothetical protein
MEVTRAGNQQGSFGASECGEAPRSNVKADRRSRPVFGWMHTRALERTHRRPVSQAAEEVDINGKVVHSGQIDSWEGFALAALRNVVGEVRGKTPCRAVLSNQERNQQQQ